MRVLLLRYLLIPFGDATSVVLLERRRVQSRGLDSVDQDRLAAPEVLVCLDDQGAPPPEHVLAAPALLLGYRGIESLRPPVGLGLAALRECGDARDQGAVLGDVERPREPLHVLTLHFLEAEEFRLVAAGLQLCVPLDFNVYTDFRYPFLLLRDSTKRPSSLIVLGGTGPP